MVARLSRALKADLKELFLAPEPKAEDLAVPRPRFRYREMPRFG